MLLRGILLAFVMGVSLVTSAMADEPSVLEQSSDGWIDLLADVGPELKGWTRVPIPPAPKGKLDSKNQWSLDTRDGPFDVLGPAWA